MCWVIKPRIDKNFWKEVGIGKKKKKKSLIRIDLEENIWKLNHTGLKITKENISLPLYFDKDIWQSCQAS